MPLRACSLAGSVRPSENLEGQPRPDLWNLEERGRLGWRWGVGWMGRGEDFQGERRGSLGARSHPVSLPCLLRRDLTPQPHARGFRGEAVISSPHTRTGA